MLVMSCLAMHMRSYPSVLSSGLYFQDKNFSFVAQVGIRNVVLVRYY